MKLVFMDFETYYDSDYSLRKMTPAEYVLDPRFESIGCAVCIDDSSPVWIDGDRLPALLSKLDPDDCAIVTHNALFDACILKWRYNFSPKIWIDTMSMSRALMGHILSGVSLEHVALKLGLGVKGKAIMKVSGMHAQDIKNAGLWTEYTDYAKTDVELCRKIFHHLKPDFPPAEFAINDMIIRCVVDPQFKLDQNALAQHLHNIKTQKDQLLVQAAFLGLEGKADLMSNEKFAEALRALGVEPPMKISPLTKKQTYAFAKTDKAFQELAEHENSAVQVLVAARLGHKSTLEETRTQRFLNIARLTWPGNEQQWMPVPLRFSGAHTHRFSGDWSLNMQNLGRDSMLRKALVAPDGHTVLACDASQIEARLTAWLAGETQLVEAFEAGADIYSQFASEIYGYPIDRKRNPAHKAQGFLGKTSILGLGFGMGPAKFYETVRIQAAAQGVEINVDQDMAARVVGLYRGKYSRIKAVWTVLQNHLEGMAYDKNYDVQFGPCRIQYQGILLPSGLRLRYQNLRRTDGGWEYTYFNKPKYIYGGKLLENIVQALDRICVMDAAVRLNARKLGVQLAHQVHDELIYVMPDHLLPIVRPALEEEMKRRPIWGDDLPLAAESKVGKSYGDLH